MGHRWGRRLQRLRRIKTARLSTVGLLAALIALGVDALGGWRAFDFASYVLMFRTRQAIAPLAWDSRIAVITIDDATLEQYGQFPISRHHYVDLLDQLLAAQPAAVGFDLLFVDPSPHDANLAAAMERHWTVVLPITATAQGNPLQPVPLLGAAAAGQGHVLVHPDKDGITRSIELYQGEVPAFSIVLLQVYHQSKKATVAAQPSNPSHHNRGDDDAPSVDVMSKPHPTSLWLNWPGPIETPIDCAAPGLGQVQMYSMACVISGQVEPAIFRNRIVLIGVTATGIDSLHTPFNLTPPASNVYLHAAALDNLLNERSLRRPPGWASIPIVTLASLISVGLLHRSRGYLVFGLPLAWMLLAAVALTAGVWLPVAAPLGAIVLAIIGGYLSAHWEKQQLMQLFSIHMDPGTAELLWQQRRPILNRGQLPVQDMMAAVLFIDIRGFTSIAEQLPSQVLMRWLNRYLDAITRVITAEGGVVDKFIGDEVMAYFGLPIHQASEQATRDCATRAVDACLCVHKSIQDLNQQILREGYSPVQVGTGIHIGTVTAGCVGNRYRLNYSIVGDTVNVAARLEELNKVVVVENPYSLLITDAVYRAIGDRYPCRRVGCFRLRGRTQRVSVYAVQSPAAQRITQ